MKEYIPNRGVEMIITFIGHSNSSEKEKLTIGVLEEIVKDNDVEFFLGGYGSFDEHAINIALQYKEKHENAKIIFVTPYIYKNYFLIGGMKRKADEIIYPEIEKVPKRLAIIRRNEWMIEKADVVIAYVKYSFGGARMSYDYAFRKNKKIINLAN